jgi:hypothetical protein
MTNIALLKGHICHLHVSLSLMPISKSPGSSLLLSALIPSRGRIKVSRRRNRPLSAGYTSREPYSSTSGNRVIRSQNRCAKHGLTNGVKHIMEGCTGKPDHYIMTLELWNTDSFNRMIAAYWKKKSY